MATLVSPGVSVSITDESQYGSAGPGTTPLIILATESNKLNVSGTGYAAGTVPANAATPYLLTSQRELVELFGQPQFKTIDGSPVHGAETNEYGLFATYSYLGIANRAYVLRADIDLGQLEPSVDEPAGEPDEGTYWVDLTTSVFGLFEAAATGTDDWTAVEYTVITDLADTTGGLGVSPLSTLGSDGDYALVATSAVTSYQFYKKVSGAWQIATGSNLSINVFAAPHYSIPTAGAIGDLWIKTTTPNSGLKAVVKKYVGANLPSASPWVAESVTAYASDAAATAASLTTEGSVYAKVAAGTANIELRTITGGVWDTFDAEASLTAPVGATPNGTLWYSSDLTADLYVKANGVWEPVTGTVTIDSTAPSSPSTDDVWIDSSDLENYPAIYTYDGSDWISRDVTDQTTPNGVVFSDLTITAGDTSNSGGATLVDSDSADAALYPDGIYCWNTMVSTGNVKQYDSTEGIWRSYSANKLNGVPFMLRKAQRAAVVRAMKQAVNNSTALREETTQFTLIAAPAYPELLEAMTTLNTDRKETAFIIVDTPFRLAPQAQTVINWATGTNVVTTGASENTPAATLNGEDGLTTTTNTAAVYYPSGITSDLRGNDVVVPPSHMVLRTMAYNDQVSYPWFAPAGLTRGVVTNASNVGYLNSEGEFIPVALTTGQRDAMYGDGSRIGVNPITRFPGQGLFVFGQRTMQSFASALDRVNVARLVAYLRERFDPLARPFIFEPNDRITRANVKQVFDGFLSDLLSKRALYDFIVVCDETNNTPARIDRNELWIDVAIEPVKAAEFIYIPIRIVNTGELSA